MQPAYKPQKTSKKALLSRSFGNSQVAKLFEKLTHEFCKLKRVRYAYGDMERKGEWFEMHAQRVVSFLFPSHETKHQIEVFRYIPAHKHPRHTFTRLKWGPLLPKRFSFKK